MKEDVLRDFLIGVASAEDLTNDLKEAILQEGVTGVHPIEDMSQTFEVTSAHLLRLCDAVLEGKLDPKNLEAVGFCLIASDQFQWDGDDTDGFRVAEVVADWSCPIMNYPLDRDNVEKWRSFLQTGVNSFPKQAKRDPTRGL